MDSAIFLKGMGLGGSLIVAIGTQNAFLLKQGLQRHYVLTCVCVCILCDALLIMAGVTGMGSVISANPNFLLWAKVGGATFLIAYGLRSARAAFRPAALTAASKETPAGYWAVIGMGLGFSLLNPHAFLDTVILLGSIGGQHEGNGRFYFAGGAIMASVLWFFTLGFGARYLAPIFAKPVAWRVLDGMIAVVMWSIAVSLFF
ncbi:LysE/ArgO family amino acid transporter [Janthinobacterium agaricidamnosum]|uniref:LysE type translocator family protein n=1 Tax=Janthinobacterium agaricidamnosum NBRC 102515 = DSM 9628 TaxID=1349767 RepID=W0V0S5_9BURK|nr:LysE/ArgO family amino acid transporter [Janthinobacterium agaricidamnosum]CDG82429.1 lysE type translocator family protein [Janthinobacterium agaricidamnosum NBRC 102515 = DSM 9628]